MSILSFRHDNTPWCSTFIFLHLGVFVYCPFLLDLSTENKEALDDIRTNCGIFLSVVDLENDLDEVLHDNLCEYLDTADPVAYLQQAKHFHMADLVEAITDADCRKIFGHYNFACLEEITK